MTTRGQNLRSTITGNVPAASTRAPGEIWMNFPDKQLGVIDTARAAQPFLAVRFFSNTADYAAGAFVVQAGGIYTAKAAITAGAFNASQWTKLATMDDSFGYMPIAGGTFTGDVILKGDPTSALMASTKQYTDNKAGLYLPLAGGTLSGQLTLAGANPTLVLNKSAAGGTNQLVGQAGGVNRWTMTLGDASSNLSDFYVYRYNDAGTFVGYSLAISRSSGLLTVANDLSIGGNTNGSGSAQFVNGLNIRASTTAQNPIVNCINGNGSTVARIYTLGVAGNAYFDNASTGVSVSIGGNIQLNGVANCTSNFTAQGTIWCGSNLSTNAAFASTAGATIGGQLAVPSSNILAFQTYPHYYGPGGTDNYFTCNGTSKYHIEQGAVWNYQFIQTSGDRGWWNNGFWGMYVGAGGTLQIGSAGAVKPGGGPWTATSDARIKNVHYEYGGGLDDVLQLRPVVFTYKGNDTRSAELEPDIPEAPPPPEVEGFSTTPGPAIAPHPFDTSFDGVNAPYPTSPHFVPAKQNQTFVGLIAQEVEAIFPSMVKQRDGYIDGEPVTDLRDIDSSELIYALVNSVKTLSSRIVQLEETVSALNRSRR